MLFSIGFVTMFIIGGLSGVTHAIVPSDYQQTDTYYVVAHFHYVLFGGAVFGLFSGVYYWWPKIFGRLLNERVGKLHFWLMLIGFNLTFAPFHILGLQGMARRTYTYPSGRGWDGWNMVSTIGAFTIAVSVLAFIYNVIWARKRGDVAGNDPWDGRTIEWTTTSPPPEYNFAEIPVIHSVDDFWHHKYVEDKEGRLVRVPSGGAEGEGHAAEHAASEHGAGHGIHMPSPSYFPLIAAIGLPVLAYGFMYSIGLVIAGAVIVLTGLYGWALEPGSE
jgi:cytochrome c oxidase subunit 1